MGHPRGDAEAKGYDDFHGEVTQRGVFRGGEPLQRVADAQTVVPSLEDGYVLLAQQHSLTAAESAA